METLPRPGEDAPGCRPLGFVESVCLSSQRASWLWGVLVGPQGLAWGTEQEGGPALWAGGHRGGWSWMSSQWGVAGRP